MKVKVYVAASWNRRLEMQKIAKQLAKAGFEVTSRWLYEHAGMAAVDAATQDLEDIDSAEALIFFSETSSAGYMSGGRHVEFGYALATGKYIYVIGEQENVFHFLPQIFHFSTLKKFKAEIQS